MRSTSPWLWRILRPHFWQIDRRVRATNRWLIMMPIILIVLAGNWAVQNLLPDFLALLDDAGAIGFVAASLPFTLFIFLMFGLLGVDDIVSQMFQAADLPILLAAPVPLKWVFLARLLQASRFAVVPGLLFGGLLFVVGLADGAAKIYYVLTAGMLLAAVVLVTAVVMTLVLLLVRWLPPRWVRSWLPVAILLLLLLLAIGQQSFTGWAMRQEALIGYLAEALVQPGQLAIVTGILGGTALAAAALAMVLFERAFFEGWNRFSVVPETRAAAAKPAVSGRARLLQPLPGPLRHIILKESLTIRRTPSSLISLGLPLVFVIILLAPLAGSQRQSSTDSPLAGLLQPLMLWYFLLFFGLLLITLPTGTPLLALLQEGAAFTLLRQTPVNMATVLWGKLAASLVPLILAWFIVLPVAGLWLAMPAWQIAILLVAFVWTLIGASIMTMAVGGLAVDFTADEVKRRLPRGANYLILGLNTLFVTLTLAAAAWSIIHLWPNSPSVSAIRALAGFRLVGWFFADTIWLPLVLLAGQIGFWLAAAKMWSAAVSRLEQWEPG